MASFQQPYWKRILDESHFLSQTFTLDVFDTFELFPLKVVILSAINCRKLSTSVISRLVKAVYNRCRNKLPFWFTGSFNNQATVQMWWRKNALIHRNRHGVLTDIHSIWFPERKVSSRALSKNWKLWGKYELMTTWVGSFLRLEMFLNTWWQYLSKTDIFQIVQLFDRRLRIFIFPTNFEL